jgi:hypothetical protein
MVIDTSTASGAAWFSGMQKARSGTATRASPKPNAERISVAINRMDKTKIVMISIAVSEESGSNRDSLMHDCEAGSCEGRRDAAEEGRLAEDAERIAKRRVRWKENPGNFEASCRRMLNFNLYRIADFTSFRA